MAATSRLAIYFHVHLVSDSTGETLNAISKAVCARFDGILPIEHIYPLVRSARQLERVLREIEDGPLGFQVWNPRVRRLFPPHAGPSHGLTRLTASSMCAVAHLSGTRAIAAT